MSEGGFNPWKLQRHPRPGYYVDYSKVSVPLPPPPKGYHWVPDSENKPALMDESTGEVMPHLPTPSDEASSGTHNAPTSLQQSSATAQEAEAVVVENAVEMPEYLEHVVMPDDTCAGVCLRYKIKASTLRSINGFVGDNIQMLKVLRIPTSHLCRGEGVAFVPQARSRDVIVQELRHACSRGGPLGDGGLSVGEAKLYLEDADWDLSAAYAAWEEDNAWEEKQLKQQQKASTSTEGSKTTSSKEKKEQQHTGETSAMPPFPTAYTAGSRSTLKKGSLKAPLLPPGAITI